MLRQIALRFAIGITLANAPLHAAAAATEILDVRETMAIYRDNKAEIDGLLAAGASYSDACNTVALRSAVLKNDNEAFRYLLSRDCKTDIADGYKQLPIHHAANTGNVDFVAMLIELGNNINAQDESGHTPLHIAIMHGHLELVHWLIVHKANVSLCSNDTVSPLRLARARCVNNTRCGDYKQIEKNNAIKDAIAQAVSIRTFQRFASGLLKLARAERMEAAHVRRAEAACSPTPSDELGDMDDVSKLDDID